MKVRMRSHASFDSAAYCVLAAIEERVRGALVGMDLVLDRQRGVERRDLIGRDALVGRRRTGPSTGTFASGARSSAQRWPSRLSEP